MLGMSLNVTQNKIARYTQPPEPPDLKTADNVSVRLKDVRYNGDITQSVLECIQTYQRVPSDYGLDGSQKLKYLHNILDGEAMGFYKSHTQPVATSYADGIEHLKDHYNMYYAKTNSG